MQSGNFLTREESNGTRRQIAQTQRPDPDPSQLLDLMAQAGEQPADFAVASFVEDHF
jgi:hypothetical protein